MFSFTCILFRSSSNFPLLLIVEDDRVADLFTTEHSRTEPSFWSPRRDDAPKEDRLACLNVFLI